MWESPPLFSFAMPRDEFDAKLGAPLEVELDSNGLGLYDLWLVRAPCGVEIAVLRFHNAPGPHNGEVRANVRDFDHIAFHLPFTVGEIGRWQPDPLAPAPCEWRVVRQDDHGTRYDVGAFTSRCEAESVACAFEAGGHKQSYWVERRSEKGR